jgi:error-prone DNA polymerase
MFVHLHVHSPFSFLDGAARVDRLVAAAAEYGMPALAITDHNNLSAAVRFHRLATAAGVKPIAGAEVTFTGGHHLTLLAQHGRGYANLCRLLTEAHLSQPRLQPAASLEALRDCREGVIALSGCWRGEIATLIRREKYEEAAATARRLREIFGRERFFLELQELALPGTKQLNASLAELAAHLGIGAVATNNVHHLRREDFLVHDVLTCARTLTTLEEVHPERPLNAQGYLRSPEEMAELFAAHPEAVEAAGQIAEQCEPALQPGKYRFPDYPTAAGESSFDLLKRLAEQGAAQRYRPVTEEVKRRLRHELSVIRELHFESYFLMVWDLLQFARARGIRTAGRGSAADSLVAYCLGITRVDPVARHLLFERFMSLERAAPPDIDVDFQAERRDEVTKYVIARYGEEHVAGVATYNTFQARSAVRDLGKALGLPQEDIERLARRLPYMTADNIEAALDRVPELRDGNLPREKYRLLLQLCRAVAGFPRHLSTHLGGLVITAEPITTLSPVQQAAKGIPIIQFDKDDVEDLGLAKLDLLCLRMLAAVEQTTRALQRDDPGFDFDAIPLDDRATYAHIASTETVGMFQLESPAQRALHARLQPECFEDIVASVAIIRPGPVQADMVRPYLARRAGKEAVRYLHPALERILGKTYGVVLFQEQVIEIATEVAGFTPGEADQLRRVMTHHRSHEEMKRIGEFFIRKALAQGVSEEVAREILSYIAAYAGYGFCEAHAAAFADTAYKTAYLLAHHPAEFYASLLSCQPMGYYPPNTIIWEAKRRGVRVVGPDVNRSELRYHIDDGAIRVGLMQVRGLGEAATDNLFAAREKGGPFASLADFQRRARLDLDATRNLILCGAFDSLCPNRRRALWELDTLATQMSSLPLDFAAPEVPLPDFTPRERWRHELSVLGVSLQRHPAQVFRPRFRQHALRVAEAKRLPPEQTARVVGLLIRPHRPPTRSGRTVVFFSLEDETGLLDVTVFERVYQQYGHTIYSSPMLLAEGIVQSQGRAGVAMIGRRFWALPEERPSHHRGH